MKSYSDRYIVKPGKKIRLRDVSPEEHGKHASREEAGPAMQKALAEMEELQYKLYAERKHSLLIVLQAMDAGGKDGVVRHVCGGMNPLGVRLHAFKQPTAEELSHDFLWRIHRFVPGKGEVAIFNRSHYEDVLVVRVHELVKEKVWSKRYDIINAFEWLLAKEANTTILKFYLHIGKDEQLKRFEDRLSDPKCNWKIAESDYSERKLWNQYQEASEDMLSKTSTDHAPWFVIPANRKWYRNLAIANIINEKLTELRLGLPPVTVDIDKIRAEYHDAKNGEDQENGKKSKRRDKVVKESASPKANTKATATIDSAKSLAKQAKQQKGKAKRKPK